MRFVISLFRHVFTPVIVLLVVFAGFVTAGVSALIEFFVLQQWLQPRGSEILFLPLLIVIALEITKFFLHFSGAAFTQNTLQQDEKKALEVFQRISKFMKWGLVLFSFLCTLIFTTNAFYYKVPGEDATTVQKAQAEIEEEYNQRFEVARALADDVYYEARETAKQAVDIAQKNYDDVEIVLTPKYQYDRTVALKNEAKKALEEAQRKYEENEKEAAAIRISAIEKARTELDEWRDEKFRQLDNSALAATADDNEYLRSFLLFFSQTFLRREYTREAYLVWVVAISLALSMLTEGIISLAQYIITCPVRVLEVIGEYNISGDMKQKMERIVRAVATAFVSIAIFLIYGGIFELSFNRVELGAAIICSLSTVLVPSAITSINWKDKDEGRWKKAAKGVVSEARAVAIKGLVSFAGFILIGFLFGETFATLSMPAIGMSIGSAAGHMLHLLPTDDRSRVPAA